MRYRIYQEDANGCLVGLPDIINCDDDATAVAWAERWSKLLGFGAAVEVWQGSRLVAGLPKRVDENS
jgi:hypothetical protein